MPTTGRQASRLVLIGWDAADWKLLNPIIDDDLMPNLAALVERGVVGKMAITSPPLPPSLWNSAVTGVKPDRHGILGFLEPDPLTGGIRPVESTSRRTKAIWNILHEEGLRSIVVNWFAGHPAEPIRGAIVSDAYPKVAGPYGADWPLVPGTIHPASLSESLQQLRVHPGDLCGDDLSLFIPHLDRINQADDPRPAFLASILAANISAHAAATWLMENESWDLLAVRYNTIDLASRIFMPFHPPAMEGLAKEDCEIYEHVVTAVCRYHDLLLGRIVQLAGPDALLVLISDRGVHVRPIGQTLSSPELSALPPAHGIVCMAGPGIRHDELVYGAELVDVAPTVLTLFGLPCGSDMQGRVLTEAFEKPLEIATIPSWENAPGDCGRHPEEFSENTWDSAAAVRHLAELGYIDKPTLDSQELLRVVRNHYDFNLARVHLAARRPAEALPLIEKLVREAPTELAYPLHLAQCYFELGRNEECRITAESVLAKDPNRAAASLILANLCLTEGEIEEGLQLLSQAEKCSCPAPEIRYLIGHVYFREGRFENAARAFQSVLTLDPEHAPAAAGLAQSLLQQGEEEQAAAAAMDAIRIQFNLPEAHYTLGIALAKTSRITRAIQAFETCLALKPAALQAHHWLAAIHEQVTKDAAKSAWHRGMAQHYLPTNA